MTAQASTSTSRLENSEVVAKTVNASRDDALQMMAKAGFDIGQAVKVVVDPQLPFMGYTMPQASGFKIVVSGGAVGTEMLNGLLVHEMSHIYRIQTGHPSHDAEILGGAIENVGKGVLRQEYRQKIVHALLNDIQDLYADDIAFKVLRLNSVIPDDQITSFLQSWVKNSAVKTDDPTRDRWINASTMVHNARAIAQMKRHNVEDAHGLAAKANQTFLDQLPSDMNREFDFFRTRLENLSENMTVGEYRTLLAEYLNRFLGIAEKD